MRGGGYPEAPEALRVPVYDNHTHLDPYVGTGSEDAEDGAEPALTPEEQLDRANAVGVAGIVQVGTDVASSRWSAALAASDPRVLAAVAIHPNEAPRLDAVGALGEALDAIDELAAQPRVRAIGETGLDFFRTEPAGIPAQRRSFEEHIRIAKKHDLALQIHDRDAHGTVLSTLEAAGAPDRTVFHCFSGDAEMARVAADRGYYLSFAGTVTFKSAQNLRDALAVTPRDRILVETDAPFLTPVPHRGRLNAPYLVPLTMRFLARELGADLDELCAQVAANTEAVYGSFAG
ncbi:TatD family hydrolase [Microbacterium sp. X-17]|uniref:TatD family hydrolase n=1 Tax=Microbacterium sp. X-17 TaxID=3144404 RepID=UPI0031F50205